MERAVVLRSPYRILVRSLFRPEQFFDGVIERIESARYGGIPGEFSQRVVMEKRSGTPNANQGRHPIVTRCDILFFRFELNWMRFIKRVEEFELVDRR